MKAVTEYPGFILVKALQTKNAMAAEGKSPEEIQTNLGTTYKIKEEKLKFFINAIEVASQNSENLKRVIVVSLAEGETAPPKAVKVDEHYYTPETLILTKAAPPQKGDRKGGRNDRGKKPKESPWGLSPEEKAAKNKKQTPAK